MAFIMKDSPECVKSELELFHLPGTQTAIQSGQWVQFHPLSNVFDGGPVEFHISGSGEDYYIDLSQTQLYVRAKIIKTDGSPLDKDGPVNLFLHFLFSQVDVTLNERLMSSSSNTHPYRAYIETLLNRGCDSKTSKLIAEMYDKHLEKRSSFFKLSSIVDMIGEASLEFCLQGKAGHKVVLEHVSRSCQSVEKSNAKYPINRVYFIPQNSMSLIQDNVFVGQMPQRIVIGCVDNDAFHGNFAKSPFELKHYHLNFIGVYVDGQPVPYNPLEPNFDNNYSSLS
ncbi:uncharacterized protein F54H12.2-like [Stegodyphus dumicola]|uniref:uncharacterized protein F54H12.2-like n=1 Tax=Stegodyphus dumicola TaxID=202533 RepID=UPI0015AE12AD|nr:uncharacterized protein F54H12.2-like [Stegodyphus dumicola]